MGSTSITGKTLVFLRHLYYLRISYLVGEPETSWQINPDAIRTAADWRRFLHDEQIEFVVRSPSYPPIVAAPLEQLEKEGFLIPYVSSEAVDFQDMWMAGKRESVQGVILRVVADAPAPVEVEKKRSTGVPAEWCYWILQYHLKDQNVGSGV